MESRSSRQLQARSRILYLEPPESLLFHRAWLERELRLSAEQRTVYRAICDTWLAELERQLQRPRSPRSFAEAGPLWPGTASAFRKLGHTLSRLQQIRFDQIVLQCRGLVALQDRQIQLKLRLSAYQVCEIHLIISRSIKQMGAIEGNSLLTTLRRRETLRAETARKLGEVLNTSQQAEWREMTGESFEPILERNLRLNGSEEGTNSEVREVPKDW